MRLSDVARASIFPEEDVLAAGIFRTGGALTARMSGFGELSVRRLERMERKSSGIPFKRYMLVVVTPTRLHIIDARSAFTRWKAGSLLGSWDRSAVRATADSKSATTRLTLEIPSENRRLDLEAPRMRRATAGEVAQLLASGTMPMRADVVPPIEPQLSPEAHEQAERLDTSHAKAGWLALTGGLIRLLGYAMPWIVLTSASSGRSVGVSGYTVLGEPILSVGYAIVIIVAAAFYLKGRRDGSTRLLLSLGVGSIIAFGIQLSVTLSKLGPLRSALQGRGLVVSLSTGIGVWVELAGAILTVAGGLYARSLSHRSRRLGSLVATVRPTPSGEPRRPDEPPRVDPVPVPPAPSPYMDYP